MLTSVGTEELEEAGDDMVNAPLVAVSIKHFSACFQVVVDATYLLLPFCGKAKKASRTRRASSDISSSFLDIIGWWRQGCLFI
jgi:hypothetical protein